MVTIFIRVGWAALVVLLSLPLAAGPREFGIAQFHAALAERGLKPERFRLRFELNHDPPQAWRIAPSRITGGDLGGLMYGLMEAAAQIRASGKLTPASGFAFMKVRSVRVRVPEQFADKLNEPWLLFLARLAQDRFNRLHIIIEHPDRHEEFLRDLAREAAGYAIEVEPRLWRPASPGNGTKPGSLLPIAAPSGVWADPLSVRATLAQADLDGHQGFEVEAPGPDGPYGHQLWGRLGYDPGIKDKVFLQDFETRFGKEAAPDLWEAFTNASRFFQLAQPSRRFFATPGEAARARLDLTPTARIAPITLASALYGYALRAQQALDRAKTKLGEGHAEWKEVEPGLRKQVTATRLLARSLTIDDFAATFRLTGNDSALYAVRRLTLAATKLAEELGEKYTPPSLDESSIRGSGPLRYPESVPLPEMLHKMPKRLVSGEPVTLSLTFSSPRHIRSVRLHYATSGVPLEFHTMEASPGSASFQVIPAGRLVYYFEIITQGNTGFFLPDPIREANLYSVSVQDSVPVQNQP
ncbi:MAG: hypothetical protein JJE04_01920 [Acidobacteriia bacterium]|nr:hypothetical protein [Terriglobia bacterium]